MTALVAKIGGSLWRSPLLAKWIAALAAYPRELTIVPGGGPFADAVRAAQGPMGFSDRAAHEMALLAMEQYALALCDLSPILELADTFDEAKAVRSRGNTPVWRPRSMTLEADIPASWDVTSDSLAAWYAREIGATRLLLIKSVDPGSAGQPRDLVDPRFSQFAGDLQVFVAGPSDLRMAPQALASGATPGVALPADGALDLKRRREHNIYHR